MLNGAIRAVAGAMIPFVGRAFDVATERASDSFVLLPRIWDVGGLYALLFRLPGG